MDWIFSQPISIVGVLSQQCYHIPANITKKSPALLPDTVDFCQEDAKQIRYENAEFVGQNIQTGRFATCAIAHRIPYFGGCNRTFSESRARDREPWYAVQIRSKLHSYHQPIAPTKQQCNVQLESCSYLFRTEQHTSSWSVKDLIVVSFPRCVSAARVHRLALVPQRFSARTMHLSYFTRVT